MLSRRSFLQLVGASVAATTLQPVTRLLAAVSDDLYQGRALTALPVYSTPRVGASSVGRLWPDSMVTIVDRQGEWYQIAGGWVQHDGIQPMLPYDPLTYQFAQEAPFWAEVAAPVAPIRAYCAADAPLVTRIGHGGVSRVIDSLPGEPNGWYGIADEKGNLLGWTQGVYWRPVMSKTEVSLGRMLYFDQHSGLMSAYEGDDLMLQAAFSSGMGLAVGTFPAQRGAIGGGQWGSTHHGLGWQTVFGAGQTVFGAGQTVAGVYWHNQFGQALPDGPTLQLAPMMARWLYEWVGDDTHIVVK